MKLHNLILLIICLSITNKSFACKCVEYDKEKMVEYGLKKYDMVFYGELIKRDTINQTYSFKIIELFKGIFISKTIEGVSEGSDCGLFPDKKGLWIVYGNFNNDNKLSLSMCSPTQSQDFGLGWPPPPEFKRDKFGKIIEPTETDSEINYLKFNIETLRSFIYQLEKLRAYKLSQNKLPKNQKNVIYDKALIISLIINTLLFSMLIFILVKKRFSSNKQISE
ncbi:hypothetical protein [Flavobacterium nackdongense]|uniref:Tissue inhibitor of metalloproteinase n=1 Tax=Flavobacterium nackdongense TaxID=2547394 RepID=A0A4P6Y5B9_9FLAO|nr:hypothetical protein [Flavobacterium nackdongense]QBN17306.1 hypothetical protein E1750_00295 [Flavobacterium nackdongense]